jgi:hypothetical protein
LDRGSQFDLAKTQGRSSRSEQIDADISVSDGKYESESHEEYEAFLAGMGESQSFDKSKGGRKGGGRKKNRSMAQRGMNKITKIITGKGSKSAPDASKGETPFEKG